MKAKNLIALLTAVILVVSVTGCKSSKDLEDGSGSGEWYWENVVSEVVVPGQEGTGTTTNKVKRPAKTVTGADGGSIQIGSGEKPMDEGLDFGGKTYVFASSGSSDPMTLRALKAFEKKYNCKFTITTPGSTGYLAKAAAAMSSGQPYDVGWFDGTHYPSAILSNLWEPLESSFTTADEFDPKHPEKGGIRIDKSVEGFYWKGHLYAVCPQKYTGLKFIAYNKLRFEEEELPDPMKLYNEGKWTWSKMIEIGKSVYKKGKYYLGGIEFRSNWVSANGGHWVISENGLFKENFSDKKIFNALKWTQDLVFGEDSIINPEQTTDVNKRMNNFIAGTNYMFLTGDYGYRTQLSPLIRESANFGSTPDERRKNLGIVPMPLGPDNTKKEYPCEQYSGISCGKGCDTRVAVAWAKFRNAYKDPVKDEYSFTTEEQKLVNSLLDGPTCVQSFYFSNSADSVANIITAITTSITTGGSDVTATLEGKRKQAQNIIDSVANQ